MGFREQPPPPVAGVEEFDPSGLHFAATGDGRVVLSDGGADLFVVDDLTAERLELELRRARREAGREPLRGAAVNRGVYRSHDDPGDDLPGAAHDPRPPEPATVLHRSPVLSDPEAPGVPAAGGACPGCGGRGSSTGQSPRTCELCRGCGRWPPKGFRLPTCRGCGCVLATDEDAGGVCIGCRTRVVREG